MKYKDFHFIFDNFKDISGLAKYVLLALAIRADEDGKAWPSKARLAEDLNLCPRSVQKCLAELIDKKIITRILDKSSNPTYFLNLDHGGETESPGKKYVDSSPTQTEAQPQVTDSPPKAETSVAVEPEVIDPEISSPDLSSSTPSSAQATTSTKKHTKSTERIPGQIIELVVKFQTAVQQSLGKTAPKITDALIAECADAVDKLIRIDGFTFDEVIETLRFAYTDNFWRNQIRSLASIRNKSKNNGCTKFQNLRQSYLNSLDKQSKNPYQDSLDARREIMKQDAAIEEEFFRQADEKGGFPSLESYLKFKREYTHQPTCNSEYQKQLQDERLTKEYYRLKNDYYRKQQQSQ